MSLRAQGKMLRRAQEGLSEASLKKAAQRLGKAGEACYPQPDPGTRPVMQAEFLGKRPWGCPGLSWLLLPLSLSPHLLLPRNRGL